MKFLVPEAFSNEYEETGEGTWLPLDTGTYREINLMLLNKFLSESNVNMTYTIKSCHFRS